LLNRLNHHFPGFFSPDKMVTAFDVKKGKPDPEPYLMALQKGGLTAEQVIVVENAPLGVLSAKAAGLFTVAVNTGILKDEELLSRGADLLYGNMREFADDLPNIFRCSNNV
jgi:beta-phosphoglucomutase-like phosphatase (HAD superfamily)